MQQKFFIAFINFIFASTATLYCALENEENSTALYAQAIALRNAKTDESTQQAKDLFYRISQLECLEKSKALHNYAMILHGEKNYEDAYKYFQQAGLSQSLGNCAEMIRCGYIKEDLYLVVGSDRGNTVEGAESHKNISHIVLGTTIDTSHVETFEGKATTMDLRASRLRNKRHIVGDVSTFDFRQYNIRHVLLERVPTVSAETFTSDFSHNLDTDNYIGKCILQMSKAMKPGAILEMEWDPFLTSTSSQEIIESVRLNPFNGFIDLYAIFQAAKLLRSNPNTEEITAKALKEQILFFHQQGLGTTLNQLIERTFLEVQILENMLQKHLPVCIRCDLETCTIEKFIEAAAQVTYSAQKNKQVKNYDFTTFIARTFLNFFMAHMAAEYNAPYVKAYIESINFSDVSVERRQNPHNRRNNVWMIRAIKS